MKYRPLTKRNHRGFNFFAGSASYFGMSFIKLKEQKDRKPAQSINQVIGEIYQKFSVITGADFRCRPPTVQV
jgi:hypothetical protein